MKKHPLKKTLVSQFFSPHLFDSIATSLQPVVASAITAVRRRAKHTTKTVQKSLIFELLQNSSKQILLNDDQTQSKTRLLRERTGNLN